MPIISGSSDGGGVGTLAFATKTLTHAQILALPTTPVQLLAAPGAASAIIPLHATLTLAWTADYTGIDAASIIHIGPGTTGTTDSLVPLNEADLLGVSGLLANGEASLSFMPALVFTPPSAATIVSVGLSGDTHTNIQNQPLSIGAGNALNFTGGNAANTLSVTVLYYVVAFA